jgi:ethanolamine utilization protein EutA (predicted chaperonin)
MIHDVPAGESHTIALNAILSHGGSSESTLYSTNPDADSLNYVDAGVILGKRLVVAEPIHMQTIATGE